MKTIYQLELHESVTTAGGICIMRVPGGWIYDMWDLTNDVSKIGTFIPYNNEFDR